MISSLKARRTAISLGALSRVPIKLVGGEVEAAI